MRCTQPMGLPTEATQFLQKHAMRDNPCWHCDRDDGPVSRVLARVGLGEDLPLHEYELKDGRTAKEIVQHEVWSSGPMIWLSLEISDGTMIEWDPKNIEED